MYVLSSLYWLDAGVHSSPLCGLQHVCGPSPVWAAACVCKGEIGWPVCPAVWLGVWQLITRRGNGYTRHSEAPVYDQSVPQDR